MEEEVAEIDAAPSICSRMWKNKRTATPDDVIRCRPFIKKTMLFKILLQVNTTRRFSSRDRPSIFPAIHASISYRCLSWAVHSQTLRYAVT